MQTINFEPEFIEGIFIQFYFYGADRTLEAEWKHIQELEYLSDEFLIKLDDIIAFLDDGDDISVILDKETDIHNLLYEFVQTNLVYPYELNSLTIVKSFGWRLKNNHLNMNLPRQVHPSIESLDEAKEQYQSFVQGKVGFYHQPEYLYHS